MQATVTVFNCGDAHIITGRILREYAKGLIIEDDRGVVYYAPFERVQRETQGSDMLW